MCAYIISTTVLNASLITRQIKKQNSVASEPVSSNANVNATHTMPLFKQSKSKKYKKTQICVLQNIHYMNIVRQKKKQRRIMKKKKK